MDKRFEDELYVFNRIRIFRHDSDFFSRLNRFFVDVLWSIRSDFPASATEALGLTRKYWYSSNEPVLLLKDAREICQRGAQQHVRESQEHGAYALVNWTAVESESDPLFVLELFLGYIQKLGTPDISVVEPMERHFGGEWHELRLFSPHAKRIGDLLLTRCENGRVERIGDDEVIYGRDGRVLLVGDRYVLYQRNGTIESIGDWKVVCGPDGYISRIGDHVVES